MRVGHTSPWRRGLTAALCCLAAGCGDSPTQASPALLDLFGDTLYRADGSMEGIEALDGVPVIGIFFGRQSCPACRAFTPTLADAYTQLRDEGKPFEVVFVSFDASQAEMFDYMNDAGMEWLAVPWRGQQAAELHHRYAVHFIPKLVIIDATAETLSMDGRDELEEQGAAAYADWLDESAGP